MTVYEMIGPILGLIFTGLGIYMIATADKEQKKQEKEAANKPASKPNLKVRGVIVTAIGLLIFIIGLIQAFM